ncbi:MAG: patatin-like phospholipase family protein [Desulfobacterales bacterium]
MTTDKRTNLSHHHELNQASPKKINLALQGGGSHGAFTWGVLDCLLESEKVRIEAISGTSAGAMNAVVVADGLMKNGRDGARENLESFWKKISEMGQSSPVQRTFYDMLTGNWNLDHSPGYVYTDLISRLASPYELNPFNMNPLQDMLAELVNFDRVRSCDRMGLFISATSVRTGKVKVFNRKELNADAIMASACLPFVFQAVEIGGEAYWDGGYMGNPVLFPFFYQCKSRDIVIVQINPLGCQETPKTARDILNRVNEITFNSSLLSELRAVDFVGRLVKDGKLDPNQYKQMLVHMIKGEQAFKPFNASSKMNTEWAFLKKLFEIGRQSAGEWLKGHYDKLGRESTVDVRAILS